MRLLPAALRALGRPLAGARRCAGTAAGQRERTPSISVHKGLKIQAALCIERPPIYVQEPDFKKRWVTFKDAWERRTNNHLTIDDEIVYMRYHFQFLMDPRAARSLAGGGSAEVSSGSAAPQLATADHSSSGLDSILSSEGLNLAFPTARRRTVTRRTAARQQAEVVNDADLKQIKRLGGRSLFLLVRYAGGKTWTFPKADREHGSPMRDTLKGMCSEQMGPGFEPYILGACPFAHRRRKSSLHPGIDGRKVFYYRARTVPGVSSDIQPASGGPLVDWAWLSREELPKHLDESEWCCVRDGLPLDMVA